MPFLDGITHWAAPTGGAVRAPELIKKARIGINPPSERRYVVQPEFFPKNRPRRRSSIDELFAVKLYFSFLQPFSDIVECDIALNDGWEHCSFFVLHMMFDAGNERLIGFFQTC